MSQDQRGRETFPDINMALKLRTPGSARENSLRLFRQIIKRRFLGKTVKKEREERRGTHLIQNAFSSFAAIVQSLHFGTPPR